jgi:hypothetical protein
MYMYYILYILCYILYIYIYKCVYVCMHVCIYAYIHIYICVYICVTYNSIGPSNRTYSIKMIRYDEKCNKINIQSRS